MKNELFDDPEFQKLIIKYLEYLQKELEIVKSKIDQKDFIAIRKFSHNLKGTGGGYGFDNFTDYGDKINIAAHEENIPSINIYISEFESELTKTIEQYNQT